MIVLGTAARLGPFVEPLTRELRTPLRPGRVHHIETARLWGQRHMMIPGDPPCGSHSYSVPRKNEWAWAWAWAWRSLNILLRGSPCNSMIMLKKCHCKLWFR